jgi:hypothetical protein
LNRAAYFRLSYGLEIIALLYHVVVIAASRDSKGA